MRLVDEELDKLSAICVLKDHYGAFVYANRQMGQWFDEPTGGFFGKTDYHLMTDQDASIIRQNDKHVLTTGSMLQTVEYIQKDGLSTGYFVTKFRLQRQDQNFLLAVIGIPLPSNVEEEETIASARKWLEANFNFVATRFRQLCERLELPRE